MSGKNYQTVKHGNLIAIIIKIVHTESADHPFHKSAEEMGFTLDKNEEPEGPPVIGETHDIVTVSRETQTSSNGRPVILIESELVPRPEPSLSTQEKPPDTNKLFGVINVSGILKRLGLKPNNNQASPTTLQPQEE